MAQEEDLGVRRMREPAGCIYCPTFASFTYPPQVQSCQYPSNHMAPFFTPLPLGAGVNICINVRGGQVQCEFLRVMLLMTCSFTQRAFPVYFSCSLERIPPVYKFHPKHIADKIFFFPKGDKTWKTDISQEENRWLVKTPLICRCFALDSGKSNCRL